MAKARCKPKSPAQIAAERSLREAQARADAADPGTWGVSRDTAAQPDVRVETETRRKVASARREDVFARLLPTQGSALAAVRRLEADMQTRAGVGDRGGLQERVDAKAWLRDAVTVRSLDAGDRVRAVLTLVGRRDALLLQELIAPMRIRTEAREGVWRVCVLQITGERGDKAQAAVVRSACENLRLAYAELERRGR